MIKERIKKAIYSFLFDENLEFFYKLLSQFELVEINSKTMKTMGVTYDKKKNNIVIVYNSEFIKKLNDHELKFVLLHEAMHLFSMHLKRAEKKDNLLANIAQDMIVNYYLINKFCPFEYYQKIKLKLVNLDEIFRIENEKNLNSDLLYVWLEKKFEKYKVLREKLNLNSITEDEIENIAKKIKIDFRTAEIFEMLLNKDEKKAEYFFDYHFFEFLPDDIKEKIISDIKECIKKYEEEKNLNKSLKDYLKANLANEELELSDQIIYSKKRKSLIQKIEKTISVISNTTNYDKSYKKLNRRNPSLKGKIKRKKIKLNIVLDTSRSIYEKSKKILQYFFEYNTEINLILIDNKIRGNYLIKNFNELKKIKILGGNGTKLQPGINFFIKEKNTPLVIITDGECDKLDLSQFKYAFLYLIDNENLDPVAQKSKKFFKFNIDSSIL